jgi:hypothetical protein
MGWTYSNSFTKEKIRDEVTRGYTREDGGYFKTLKSEFCGNILWALHESTRYVDLNGNKLDTPETVRYIGCYFFCGSGYKDMDETMHPYYYNCPLSYLDEVTEPLNSRSREWREKVRNER